MPQYEYQTNGEGQNDDDDDTMGDASPTFKIPGKFPNLGKKGKSVVMHMCHLCPYKSPYKQSLRSHYIRHTNERPYACDMCSYEAKRQQDLNKHKMLKHNKKVTKAKKPRPVAVTISDAELENGTSTSAASGGTEPEEQESLLQTARTWITNDCDNFYDVPGRSYRKTPLLPSPSMPVFPEPMPVTERGSPGLGMKIKTEPETDGYGEESPQASPQAEAENDNDDSTSDNQEENGETLDNHSPSIYSFTEDKIDNFSDSNSKDKDNSPVGEPPGPSNSSSVLSLLLQRSPLLLRKQKELQSLGNAAFPVPHRYRGTNRDLRNLSALNLSADAANYHEEKLASLHHNESFNHLPPGGAVSLDNLPVPGGFPVSQTVVRMCGEERKAWYCKHCDILYFDGAVFFIHMGTHDLNNPWTCSLCGNTYTDVYSFSSHFVNQHRAVKP